MRYHIHTIDHKLTSLLSPRPKCKKKKKIIEHLVFQFAKHIVRRNLLFLAIFIELVYFQFFKCLLIFSFNSFIGFYISIIFLVNLLIDKIIIVMYFITRNSAERLQAVYI